MKIRSASIVFLLATPLAAQDAGPHAPELREHAFRAHLEFLASDLCEGRAVGTRGGELAAAYIAAQFEAVGLQPPPGVDGYFQQVPLQGLETRQDTIEFRARSGDETIELQPIEEVVVNSELTSESIEFKGDLLFVGYGIEAPELGWDDYKGVDVAGKTLVMVINDPDFERTGFGGESLTYYGRWTYKEDIARAKGAAGLVLLHTTKSASYGFQVIQSSWTGERVSFVDPDLHPLSVNLWLSQPAADKILAPVGQSYAKLLELAESRDFHPLALDIEIEASFEQDHREMQSPNVLGVLPGTTKADEVVIYTAHYDHLGVGLPDDNGDTIYNGAMDNASGTSVLIELARAYAAAEPCERSILFFANTGEESGLLGSSYYANNPVYPLEKTTVVLNKDVTEMLGRRKGFGAFPVDFSDAVETVTELGESIGVTFAPAGVDRSGRAFRSDHFSFAARGVVAMSIGMSGDYESLSEEDVASIRERIGNTYHQPSDEVHPLWDYAGALQEMQLLYRIGRHYADGAPAPKMLPDNPYVATQRLFSQR